MYKRLFCLLAAFCLLAGCAPEQDAEGTPVKVYTVTEPKAEDKAHAVLTEKTLFCPEGEQPARFALFAALPHGADADGVVIENGIARVTLSEDTLSGFSLTLAYACIVLTLTGFDGIDAVRIAAEGQAPILLRAEDFIVGSLVVEGAERDVTLYFPDGGGGVLSETRTLVVRETDTLDWYLKYMVEELIAGPKTPGLRSVMPEGTRLFSVIVTENDCTVNLSGEFTGAADSSAARMAMHCLVRSATAFPEVSSLRLMVDGQAIDEYFGIDTSGPLVSVTLF